jgi:hypothetical protein
MSGGVPKTNLDDILDKANNNGSISMLGLTEYERRQLVEHLRTESNYRYIQDRETKQLLLADAIIREREKVFDGVKLTKTEEKLHQYSKDMYECALKTKKDVEEVDSYQLPETYDGDGQLDNRKRHKVIYERYDEIKQEPKEEDIWAEQQLKIARP